MQPVNRLAGGTLMSSRCLATVFAAPIGAIQGSHEVLRASEDLERLATTGVAYEPRQAARQSNVGIQRRPALLFERGKGSAHPPTSTECDQ